MFMKRNSISEDYLERLKAVQSEIKELEKDTALPKLKKFTASTRTFPRGDMEIFEYIYNIMRNKANPLYPPTTAYGLYDGNCIYMWECFSEYFKELADYCKNLDEKISRIEQLKDEEKQLKNTLGIN